MWKSGGDVTYRIKTRLKENRHDWAALGAALTTCAQYFLQAPTPTLHCFFFPPPTLGLSTQPLLYVY